MKISIEIYTTEFGPDSPSDYEKRVLLALAGVSTQRVGNVEMTIDPEVASGETQAQEHGEDVVPADAADNDGLKESTAELEEHDADEPPASAQGEDEVDDRPRHPSGRVVGQPSPGKKRRNSDEVAEDKAWEEAQKAQKAAQQGQEQPQGGVATPDNTAVPQQAAQPAPQAGFGFGFGQQQAAPQAPPQPQGGGVFPGF